MFRLTASRSSNSARLIIGKQSLTKRLFSNVQNYDALVLGAYTDTNAVTLTANKDISSETSQLIQEQLRVSNFSKPGQVRTLYNVGGMKQVAIVSLGKESEVKENTAEAARRATALGLHTLKPQGAKIIGVDISLNAHGAGEGSVLSQFSFNKLKSSEKEEEDITVGPFSAAEGNSSDWTQGQIYGASQNVARMLMTSPGNLMTPKLFAEEVAYLLAGLENVEVIVRDEEWAQMQNMNAFLSVAKGSVEPLRFLEIHYKGGKQGEQPHGLVGKGKLPVKKGERGLI